MKIHEYQGKEILRQFGVPVPRGIPAFTVQEAVEAAQKLGGPVWVVKAQIHAGGRGKGGGVKVAKSIEDVQKLAGDILGMQLKTHQTGPEGQKVRRLYIEEGADIQKEYYLSVVTDRGTQKVAFIASSEGGMDIEEVAHSNPEKIIKIFIDPAIGLTAEQGEELAQGVGMSRISDLAVKMGVVKKMDEVLAMALGAGETTPFRLTAAYAAFVNGGRRVEPHLIELVQDRNGETIFRGDKRDCPRCNAAFNGDESPRVAPDGDQVMDPITAYQITSMLQGVVQRGTATSALVLNRPVGGKTGTTNEYRSAWFVGFTPQVVAGVFVGFDDNRSLGEGETGTTAAVPVFGDPLAVEESDADPDDHHHHRGDGIDRRVEAQPCAREDHQRHRRRAGAGEEGRQHHVVEREGEGQQPGREQGLRDHRDGDQEKDLPGFGAEVLGGFLKLRV